MKKFSGYDEIPVTEGGKRLPAGPYKCVIKQAKEEEWSNCNGSSMVLCVDIAEGEHKDHFKQDFESQTNNKKWRGIFRITIPTDSSSDKAKSFFRGVTASIEKSNPGYHFDFDEKSMKNMKDKKIGIVFGEEEYEKDGQVKVAIKPFYARSYDNVLSEEVPERKKLQNTSQNSGWTPQQQADDPEDDLPF